MKVGVIGLGAMGAPMARNLHQAGLLQAVWNRTASKAEQLAAELSVTFASTPSQLATQCDVILTCISADDDLRAVIDALGDGLAENKIVVDTSTVQPQTARELAMLLAQLGVAFVDAPVSGGVEGAKNGTLAMMAGGDADVIEKLQPLFAAIGSKITHMGEVGCGQATKAVNQVMAAGINQAVTEALAFARAQNLPMHKVIDVISGGAAGNWFLQHRGPSMVEAIFEPGFKVSLHHKDLQICKAIAEELGVALPVVEMTLVHYWRLMNAGYGDEDISSLYREKQQLFS